MKELNKLIKEMMGKPMTKKQQALLEVLRGKVKAKELTVEQCQRIWAKKVLRKKK